MSNLNSSSGCSTFNVKVHREKISQFVAAGRNEEEYEWKLRKKLVALIILPSERLLYALDPKGTRKRLSRRALMVSGRQG